MENWEMVSDCVRSWVWLGVSVSGATLVGRHPEPVRSWGLPK